MPRQSVYSVRLSVGHCHRPRLSLCPSSVRVDCRLQTRLSLVLLASGYVSKAGQGRPGRPRFNVTTTCAAALARTEQNVLGAVYLRREIVRSPAIGVKFLHEFTVSGHDLRIACTFLEAQYRKRLLGVHIGAGIRLCTRLLTEGAFPGKALLQVAAQ